MIEIKFKIIARFGFENDEKLIRFDRRKTRFIKIVKKCLEYWKGEVEGP